MLDQRGNPLAFRYNRYGLAARITAAGQQTRYLYDERGLVSDVISEHLQSGEVSRSLKFERDEFDRVVRTTYADGTVESTAYDLWGRPERITRDRRETTFRYDYFGRLSEKVESGVTTRYAYNPWGQRTLRETVNGSLKLREERAYDAFGRLTRISSGTAETTYAYNDRNQLSRQTINGVPLDFRYTAAGWLAEKTMGGATPLTRLRYFYAPSGEITGREVNGRRQDYRYDRLGQLRQVLDASGEVLENYAYDPAGNILEKTVNGKTTRYEYDSANQLISSTSEGKTVKYSYDSAGRLVKEGNLVYTYKGLDKLTEVKLHLLRGGTAGERHAGGEDRIVPLGRSGADRPRRDRLPQ